MNAWYDRKIGTPFAHPVMDDSSSVADAEIHDDETAATATATATATAATLPNGNICKTDPAH